MAAGWHGAANPFTPESVRVCVRGSVASRPEGGERGSGSRSRTRTVSDQHSPRARGREPARGDETGPKITGARRGPGPSRAPSAVGLGKISLTWGGHLTAYFGRGPRAGKARLRLPPLPAQMMLERDKRRSRSLVPPPSRHLSRQMSPLLQLQSLSRKPQQRALRAQRACARFAAQTCVKGGDRKGGERGGRGLGVYV